MAEIISVPPGLERVVSLFSGGDRENPNAALDTFVVVVIREAEKRGITLSDSDKVALRSASTVAEAQRFVATEINADLAAAAVDELRLIAEQQDITQAMATTAEEEARQRLFAEAIEVAKQDPGLKYDTADQTFWAQVSPNSPVWTQVDAEGVAQGLRTALADDEGLAITRVQEVDWGFPPLPTREDDEEDEPFIGGIPADFLSNRQVRDPRIFTAEGVSAEDFERADPYGPRPAVPVFRDFDQYNLFAGLPAEEIASWQNMLFEAGYLKKSEISGQLGVFMGKTPHMMEQAMFDATVNGYEDDLAGWLGYVGGVRANMTDDEKRAAAGIRPFTTPAYKAPDYASLSQAVRQSIGQTLGRTPHDWELALLGKQLNGDYRSQFDVEVAALRSEYDAGNKALLEETDTSAGSFRAVNPLDRLNETIETRYKDEIDTNLRVSETQQNTQHLMNLLSGLEGAI